MIYSLPGYAQGQDIRTRPIQVVHILGGIQQKALQFSPGHIIIFLHQRIDFLAGYGQIDNVFT